MAAEAVVALMAATAAAVPVSGELVPVVGAAVSMEAVLGGRARAVRVVAGEAVAAGGPDDLRGYAVGERAAAAAAAAG